MLYPEKITIKLIWVDYEASSPNTWLHTMLQVALLRIVILSESQNRSGWRKTQKYSLLVGTWVNSLLG